MNITKVSERKGKPVYFVNDEEVKKSVFVKSVTENSKQLKKNYSAYKNVDKLKTKSKEIIGPLVYMIECFDSNERFIKIGITRGKLRNRFNDLPYNYKLILSKNVKESDLFRYESELHKHIINFSYRPKKKFGGHTECFTIEAKNHINKYIG